MQFFPLAEVPSILFFFCNSLDNEIGSNIFQEPEQHLSVVECVLTGVVICALTLWSTKYSTTELLVKQ